MNPMDAVKKIRSFLGTSRSILSIFSENRTESEASTVSPTDNEDFAKAVQFLHHDDIFLVAAEMGDEKALQRVIKAGGPIHERDHLGRNALHFAVCSRNRQAVLLLLKAGINPNVKDNVGMTPLSLCLMRTPSWSMANMLFDYGAKILPRSNPMDTGLFLQFVMMCIPTIKEESILRLLVQKGSLVNDPDAPGGRQALHFAAMSDNCHLIGILLDLGADLFLTNHRNQTPRDVAVTFKCKEANRLLAYYEKCYANHVDVVDRVA